MSRKIVIIPLFASAHFLKCWIPNVIDVIDPDVIIINEGLMPNGPENKTQIDDEFRKKWCYKNTNAGFDWEETREIVTGNYWGKRPLIICGIVDYDAADANQCFLDAISTFPANEYWSTIPEVGDVILPLEPDAFHHEMDKDKIAELVSQLKPGEGIQTRWTDFLETQYYTEGINVSKPKYRRFAYCFDNMENYKAAMSGFMSQNYPRLRKVDDFITYHYCWFQPEPYKQLRYELIYRSNPQYWKDFDAGLREIRDMSEQLVNDYKSGDIDILHPRSLLAGNRDITIRPSRTDEGRYAKFIDIDHPKHIRSHPNFVK